MKHINIFHIMAAALLAFSAPAFATDPAPRLLGGTAATSASAAFVGGTGRSTSQMETGNRSWGNASYRRGAQQSIAGSESYGIGKSTGHGAFAGFGSGIGGAFTIGRF